MTAPEILTFVRTQGIVLTAHGDRLVVDAPTGALTAELRVELVRHKPALIAMLTPPFVTLNDGPTLPVAALALALDLEDRGFSLALDATGQAVIEPRAALTGGDSLLAASSGCDPRLHRSGRGMKSPILERDEHRNLDEASPVPLRVPKTDPSPLRQGDPSPSQQRRASAARTNTRGHEPFEPRLLSAQDAARYLGVPYTSLRDWALGGHVPIVRAPGCRRLWFDRRDLDRATEAWKERGIG